MSDERNSEVDVQVETEVLPRRTILRVMAVTVTLVVGLCALAYLFLRIAENALRPTMEPSASDLSPPRDVAGVQSEPFRVAHPAPAPGTEQRLALSRYGWVDRSRGIVRIPIERAMDLIADGWKPGSTGR